MPTPRILRRVLLPLGTAAAILGLAAGAVGGGLAVGDDVPSVPAATPPPPADQGTSMLEHEGIDPATQRQGATSPTGDTVYRSTDGDTTCLIDERGSGHCPETDGINAGRGFGGQLCVEGLPEHLTRVTGLVPTSAVAVTLSTGAGTTFRQTPVRGTVAFEIPRDEAAADDHVDVTWTLDTGGTKTVQVPMPPFIRGLTCE